MATSITTSCGYCFRRWWWSLWCWRKGRWFPFQTQILRPKTKMPVCASRHSSTAVSWVCWLSVQDVSVVCQLLPICWTSHQSTSRNVSRTCRAVHRSTSSTRLPLPPSASNCSTATRPSRRSRPASTSPTSPSSASSSKSTLVCHPPTIGNGILKTGDGCCHSDFRRFPPKLNNYRISFALSNYNRLINCISFSCVKNHLSK